jgi:hypothetical protein
MPRNIEKVPRTLKCVEAESSRSVKISLNTDRRGTDEPVIPAIHHLDISQGCV